MSNSLIRLLKWVGYPLFALATFVIALYITFPFDKLRVRAEEFLNTSEDMQVTIGKLGPSPLFGAYAEDVVVRLKQKKKDRGFSPDMTTAGAEGAESPGAEEGSDPAESAGTGEDPGRGKAAAADKDKGKGKGGGPGFTRIVVDRLKGSVGLLALLSGGLDLSFRAEGMGGSLAGRYVKDKKKGFSVDARAEDFKLASMPFVSESAGIPLEGTLSVKVKLKSPQGRVIDAEGAVELDFEGLVVGDGKWKLKIPGNPLLAMGLTLPRLAVGSLGGKIKLEKGTATFEKMSAKGTDVQMDLEGSIALRQPLGLSTIQAYLKFKVSPALKQKDPKFELLESSLNSAKRPDGYFGLRIFGTLNRPQALPSRLGPPRGGGG